MAYNFTDLYQKPQNTGYFSGGQMYSVGLSLWIVFPAQYIGNGNELTQGHLTELHNLAFFLKFKIYSTKFMALIINI